LLQGPPPLGTAKEISYAWFDILDDNVGAMSTHIFRMLTNDQNFSSDIRVVVLPCSIVLIILRVRAETHVRDQTVGLIFDFRNYPEPSRELANREQSDADFPNQRTPTWSAVWIVLGGDAEVDSLRRAFSTAPNLVHHA
jgi:hypothetical protein